MGVKRVSIYCRIYWFVFKKYLYFHEKNTVVIDSMKHFYMLFYNKSFVLNEVFLMAFPRMAKFYILSKVKNLEKELANEKHR